MKLKKDPLKFQKIQNSYKEYSNKKKLENRPPQKWAFWFQIQFRNFQKSKMKLKKDPLKFKKIQNRYKEHSNKKKLENRPPQKWAFWF